MCVPAVPKVTMQAQERNESNMERKSTFPVTLRTTPSIIADTW